MKRFRVAVLLSILPAQLLLSSAGHASPLNPATEDRFRTFADDDRYTVRAHRSKAGFDGENSTSGGGDTYAEFRRAPARVCTSGIGRVEVDEPLPPPSEVERSPDCQTDGLNIVFDRATCSPGEVSVDPLFTRVRDASSANGWSPWEMLDNGCLPAVDVQSAVAEAFQQLRLAPSPLSVQPPSGWTLVNAETIAFADDAPQTLATTVLGVGVSIRATAETFTWAFGDGSESLTTTDPGRPWPDHTISHRYTAEGTHSITLTTTWSGTFQVAGSTEWRPVDGTATTTSTSPPLTVYEARSRLVSGSAG
jgi:hypothetical protein